MPYGDCYVCLTLILCSAFMGRSGGGGAAQRVLPQSMTEKSSDADRKAHSVGAHRGDE